MPIHYPVHASGETYQTLWDSSGRAIAGGLSREDAEEIVAARSVLRDEIVNALRDLRENFIPVNRALEIVVDVADGNLMKNRT